MYKRQAWGVPLWQMLGGKFRDKVRMYCDTDVDGKHTGTDMGHALKKRMEQGFTFLKMDLEMCIRDRLKVISLSKTYVSYF